MRSLNEIISRNALIAWEEARTEARKQGYDLNIPELARRMARYMERPAASTKADQPYTQKSLDPTLRRLLTPVPDRVWRIDYVEAFAVAVSVPVERLFTVAGRVTDQAEANQVARLVETHLNRQQAQELQRYLHDSALRPGMYDLTIALARAVSTAETSDEAHGRTSRLIAAVKKWPGLPVRRRRKK